MLPKAISTDSDLALAAYIYRLVCCLCLTNSWVSRLAGEAPVSKRIN